MPVRQLPEKFQVAFSLAGEQRELVRTIAEAVERRLGESSVFLDEWFEFYIGGHDADLRLQDFYGQRCELVVVCVSGDYGGKPWTQMEHEAIRARLMQIRSSAEEADRLRIFPIRVGDGDVPGIPYNAIAPDFRTKSADQAAEEIVARLRLIVPAPPPPPPASD